MVGIVGANGAGKTTLFKMITGVDEPDAGKVVVGETVKLMYVDQDRGSSTIQDRLRGTQRRGGGDLLARAR